MMNPYDERVGAGAEDTGLVCPHCAYNLTGLTEERCPECGEAFDLARLRALCAGEVRAATPFERAPSLRTWVETWCMGCIEPGRLAREFPRRHNHDRAIGYSFCCYATAGLLFCTALALAAVMVGGDAVGRVTFVGLVGTVASGVICELVLALMLTALVPLYPCDQRDSFRAWRGLVAYMGGFMIITAAELACIFIALLVTKGRASGFVNFGILLTGVNFVWWVVCVCVMICARARPNGRRLVACVLTVVIGAACVALGVFIDVLIVVTA